MIPCPSQSWNVSSSERESVVKTAKQLDREVSPSERKKDHNSFPQRSSSNIWTMAQATAISGIPAIASVVAGALQHFDNQRYRLFAWCIMPNHVHVVVRVFPGHPLAEVIHSWKSFSAKRANDLLNCDGGFWQREYYDHLIRSESEFERAVRYVAENPEKAGLRNWRWVWVGGRDAHPTAGETPALQKPGPSS